MNILWRLQRKITKTLIAHSSNPHPPSYPFVSGDTFRDLADHIFEFQNMASFKPESVKRNDIVFVQSDAIDIYFLKAHPYIQNPYKLITHNGDREIAKKELVLIDDKIIHWFAQNVLVSHPKLTPIPIGIENASYANAGHTKFFKKPVTNKHSAERNGGIYANFNAATNPRERMACLEALRNSPLADIVGRKSQPAYVTDVQRYLAVASPPGNGEDCIRTWEAMLLGAMPIVKRSVGIEFFKGLGLPMMVVDSWDELSRLTRDELATRYDSTMSQANTKPLYMDYWKELIQNTGHE